MKTTGKIMRVAMLVLAFAGMPSGCVVDGGRVRVGAVFYWPLPGPWFYDGPWVDGHGWYRDGGVFVNPPSFGGPMPHLPNRIRPGQGLRGR